MSLDNPQRRLGLGTKLAFGIGASAEQILLTAIGTYAMFYYNQVLGLSATLAGLAITLGILLDGVVDPFIGSISDRTRSRLGRRHPFLFIAPIPIAICLFAIFHPPAALSGLWLFAWFLGFVVSVRIASSSYHLPHLAMGAELSTDFTERSRVMSFFTFGQVIGNTATSFLALSIFFHATAKYPRGLLNPDAYSPFAITAVIAILVVQYTSAWFTRKSVKNFKPLSADVVSFTGREFTTDIRRVLSNPNYLAIIFGIFSFALIMSCLSGLYLYLYTFFWRLKSEEIRWLSVALLVGSVLSFSLTAAIQQRLGKRLVLRVAALLMPVPLATVITLHLLGILPDGRDPIVLPLLMLASGSSTFLSTVVTIASMSALGDIADENELRYGMRQEGLLYSTRTVLSKVDSALGQLLVGVFLDVTHFPRGAAPEAIDPSLVWPLGLLGGPLLLIPAALAAFFFGRFKIDQRQHAEILRQLDLRGAAPGPKPGEPAPPLSPIVSPAE